VISISSCESADQVCINFGSCCCSCSSSSSSSSCCSCCSYDYCQTTTTQCTAAISATYIFSPALQNHDLAAPAATSLQNHDLDAAADDVMILLQEHNYIIT
jgi:hypothetical protein